MALNLASHRRWINASPVDTCVCGVNAITVLVTELCRCLDAFVRCTADADAWAKAIAVLEAILTVALKALLTDTQVAQTAVGRK